MTVTFRSGFRGKYIVEEIIVVEGHEIDLNARYKAFKERADKIFSEELTWQ